MITSPVSPRSLADATPLQRLYHWETEAPTRVSLRQPVEGRTLDFSWGEIADQVRRMAAHLRELGQEQRWEPGARIAILSKNCAWWLMSDLAIWMAGYVSVPLYPTLAPDTVRQILTHSGARLVFVGKLDDWDTMKAGVPADLPGLSFPVSPEDAQDRYDTWDAVCHGTDPLRGRPLPDPAALATIIYTSGTTGTPKGVMHSFATLAVAITMGLKRMPMTDADRLLSYLPLAHVVERVLVEQAWLRVGLTVYFSESLERFAEDLRHAKPTVFFSVPRLWTKFQQGVLQRLPQRRLDLLLGLPWIGGVVRRKVLAALGLDQCRLAVGGAAPMPVGLLRWYRALGLPVNEGYGMTENLAVSHITVPGKDQTGSVGPAYDGVSTRLDPITGELQMKSAALMLGYFKDEALSAQAFTADGWLHTGDKGEIADSGALAGCVRITGRVKDLFKTSKGKYVAPAPIEDRLSLHPSLEAVAVTGADRPQPVALAMLSEEAARRAAQPGQREQLLVELERHLDAVNAKLDPHEQLDALIVTREPWTVANGLITPTLKVRRDRLDARFGPQLDDWLARRRKVLLAD